MERQFQFSVRNIMVATAIVAAWCAAFAAYDRVAPVAVPNYVRILWVALILILPATAVGAFAGRPILGFVCGVGSALGWLAVVLQSMYS